MSWGALTINGPSDHQPRFFGLSLCLWCLGFWRSRWFSAQVLAVATGSGAANSVSDFTSGAACATGAGRCLDRAAAQGFSQLGASAKNRRASATGASAVHSRARPVWCIRPPLVRPQPLGCAARARRAGLGFFPQARRHLPSCVLPEASAPSATSAWACGGTVSLWLFCWCLCVSVLAGGFAVGPQHQRLAASAGAFGVRLATAFSLRPCGGLRVRFGFSAGASVTAFSCCLKQRGRPFWLSSGCVIVLIGMVASSLPFSF